MTFDASSKITSLECFGEDPIRMRIFDQHLHVCNQPLLFLESTLIGLQLSHLVMQFGIVPDVKLQAECL